jgi:hypothetical protein
MNIKILNVLLSILLTSCSVSLHGNKESSKPNKEKITSYFVGKNEICSKQEGQLIELKLKKVVINTDLYSSTDQESYCLITGDLAGDEKTFSSSYKSACRKILNFKQGPLIKSQKITLKVIQDHVCQVL